MGTQALGRHTGLLGWGDVGDRSLSSSWALEEIPPEVMRMRQEGVVWERKQCHMQGPSWTLQAGPVCPVPPPSVWKEAFRCTPQAHPCLCLSHSSNQRLVWWQWWCWRQCWWRESGGDTVCDGNWRQRQKQFCPIRTCDKSLKMRLILNGWVERWSVEAKNGRSRESQDFSWQNLKDFRCLAEDEMVGWHHQLDGHEFEQAPGVGDGQGSLACCSPWSRKESDMNWTEVSANCMWLVWTGAEWWLLPSKSMCSVSTSNKSKITVPIETPLPSCLLLRNAFPENQLMITNGWTLTIWLTMS